MRSLCLAILLTCGAVAQASPVQLNVLPAKPVVFTADFKHQDANGNEVEVLAPWFAFRLHVFNQAADTLNLIGLRVEVSGVNDDGDKFTETIQFSPGDYNTDKCFYNDLGRFDANGTPSGPVFNDKNLFLTPTKASAVDCFNGELTFYISNLPAQSNKNGNGYKYQVRVQPLGWFEAGGAPKARFDEFVTLTTQ